MTLTSGQRVAHYEILEPLAAGGMGEVFVALDTHLDRRVALKVLPDSVGGSPAARARFEREAKTLAGVSHPNILTIHDYATDGDLYFAVTELLEGETLAERLGREGALPVEHAMRIAQLTARGLAAAHRRQIVHRDIKPSNLFLQSDGGVKILDFGLARSHDSVVSRGTQAETLVDATVPGTILGTYGYMSPEQARGLPADARSDVFAFGCVLYEMLAGEGPFRRRTNSDALAAVLQEDPRSLRERCAGVPIELEGLVDRCLAKDPEERPASAEELARVIDTLAGAGSAPREPATRRRPALVALGLVALVAAALLVATLHRQSQERQARQKVLPEIEHLVDAGEYASAVARTGEIEDLLEGDPALADLVERATGLFAFETEPAGATVEVRPYDDSAAAWETLGTTPLATRRLPIGAYRLRVSLAGYETRELAVAVDRPPPGAASFPDFEWRGLPWGLEKLALSENGAPGDMEPVQGGPYGPVPLNRMQLGARNLQAYSIDRTEVTNRAYQEFVDGGGYANPELWPPSFERDGRVLGFGDAVASFRDTTGRPGPAAWVLGRPPEGLEEHPVAGVSWYEASAYCAFRGKSLPTIYHWVRAALASSDYWAPLAHHIVAASNFAGAGTEPVATRAGLGLMGTYDQAGNVSEWTSTAFGQDRYSLGGSFSDPPYSFNQPFPHSPWDRSPRDGLRCVRYDEEPDPALLAALEPPPQTLLGLPPLSDQTFAALEQLSRYERRPLNPEIEPFEDRPWGRQQWVTIDGPEGTDRLPVRLHLPAAGAGPFPVIVYFPGIWCAIAPALRGTEIPPDFRFLVEEGYAFVEPVYSGVFERNADGSTMQRIFSATDGPALFRLWQRDLSRTLDYLEERPELDSSRVAYLGFSLGTVVAPHLLPFEPRVRAAVLLAGGFSAEVAQSRLDLSAGLLQRITVSTLMLGTAWDHLFPPETRQRTFFDYLGSPPEDKRLVIYPVGGHGDLPQTELIKESLAWLERYLDGS